LIDEINTKYFKVFLYDDVDKYQTITVERIGPFWKLNGFSTYVNKTNDSLKLIGWCHLQIKDKGVTVVPVQSFDRNVAYIKMGSFSDELIKDIPYGEIVVFTWDKIVRWNDLNAVAYSNEDKPLYTLGYEIINSYIDINGLKWISVN